MTRGHIPAPGGASGPRTWSLPQPRRFLETSRRDGWWIQPVGVVLGLGAFVLYATWAALQGKHYWVGAVPDSPGIRQYLSPFYSPVLFDAPGVTSGHAWFGPWPAWLSWLPRALMTPALLILWAPGLFRVTCYYYRGAYYKAFWQDPPACAVGEPQWRGARYRGEQSFPLILQNLHRYTLYLALVFLVILSYDAVKAFMFINQDTGRAEFGIGVGSLVLLVNPVLLGGYTLGCHSFRHLIGGRLDRLAGRPARALAYDCASCLNRRHMAWAWTSLFWVGFCDLYVRLVAMGVWTDYRLL